MKRTVRRTVVAAVAASILTLGTLATTLGARAQDTARPAAAPRAAASKGGAAPAAFHELFDLSQQTKKGLTFHVNGQTIAGIVTRVGDDTVEVKNQTHDRIAIRLDRIDAVAVN